MYSRGGDVSTKEPETLQTELLDDKKVVKTKGSLIKWVVNREFQVIKRKGVVHKLFVLCESVMRDCDIERSL